jgi:phage recombination protein Bet
MEDTQMTTALTTLTSNLAKQFNMGDGSELASTLKATCFKSGTQVTDAQMTALLIVAQQYGLNPFTKEIYAFPDKGGIVPVVGLDGWSRIINSRPEFDGMDFEQNAESCTCTIYRKDRSHPIKVTEWMAECKRSAGPWLSHPYRMLRHKAMIQCARLAFGFAGIYEPDEAERIVESDAPKKVDPITGEITSVTFDILMALDAIEACSNAEEWNTVWKAEGAKAVAAKDNAGHAALKAAAIEKKAKLLAESNITDAEVK